MSKTVVKPRTKVRTKTQRPPLYKVILLNDDYTPREFVVLVLKAVFRMNEDQAYRVKGRLCHRCLCQGRCGNQGEGSNRTRKAERLSAVFHY
jgi:ATP-dependent Clp protease adaptor protein ClpS